MRSLLSSFTIISLIGLSTYFISCTDPITADESYEISFNSPTDSSQLTCAQDQDSSTTTQIETDVSLLVTFPSSKQSDLVVVLTSDVESFIEQRSTLNSTGRVLFESIAFDVGQHTLTAQLLEGAELVASSEITIEAIIDPNDIRCGQSESRLVITNLQMDQVLSANDDLDQDLTNGLQIEVLVSVEGPVVNDLLEIRVNDQVQGRVNSGDGNARFDEVTLELDQSATISVLAQSPTGIIETSVRVNVSASSCALTVTPAPMDGCDISSALDVQPEVEGLQVELQAQTDCAQVIWTINGETLETVEVVDGQAVIVVNMVNGENTIQVKAESNNGLSAQLPLYILDAVVNDPQIDFEGVMLMGNNDRGLLQAIPDSIDPNTQTAQWEFIGFTAEVAEGSRISLTYDPPIDGAPTEAITDANGRFNLTIAGQYLCGYTMQASVIDECGGTHQSPVYSFCLDAVSPSIEILDPTNDTLVTRALDSDSETEGLQIAVSLAVTDPRVDVDYPIEIQCSTELDSTFVTVSDTAVSLSEMQIDPDQAGVYTGQIIVTFTQADQYTCRAVALTGINPVQVPSQSFRVITDEPTFTLLDPSFNQQGVACVADSLFIGGRGSQLVAEDTILNFSILSESGQIVRQGQLNLIEDLDFGIEIPIGPQGLNDGSYLLEISGESASIPVAMIPLEPIVMQVDRTPPELALISPSSTRLDRNDDVNNDMSDCIQTPIQVSLNDQSAEQICYALNQDQPRCETVNAMGILETEELNFVPGENNLVLSVLDCTGAKQTLDVTIEALGCDPPLRVTTPSNASILSLSDDEDAEQMGWQVTANITGNPSEEANIEVTGNGVMLNFGPIILDQNGLGSLLLNLPSPSAEDLSLTLKAVSTQREGWSNQITLIDITPNIVLDPIIEANRCVNLEISDASAQNGFQLNFKANAEGLSQDQAPILTITCNEDFSTSKRGRVTALGPYVSRIDFDAVSLVDEGACTATVSAVDGQQQTVEHTLEFVIDRIVPEVSLETPLSSTLTLLDDTNFAQAGIQSTVTLNVCGASGQTLFLSVNPAQTNMEQMLNLGEEECSLVESEMLSFDEGSYTLNAAVSDACGNQTTYRQELLIDTGVAVSIVDPDDQSIISASLDLDEADGCQFDMSATSTGFTSLNQLNLFVCSDVTGEGNNDPLCGGGTRVTTENCEALDPEARDMICQVSLTDALQQLTVVAEQNGNIIRSIPISLYSDCSPPTVESLQVVEDIDQNACINRQERSNRGSSSANATFNVDFQVTGFNDGTTVNLRALPGERLLAQATVNQGIGTFIGVNLNPGEHLLYMSGLDQAQNTLPLANSDLFNPLPLRVDTTVPQPVATFPEQNVCLGIDDDQSLALNTLQFNPVLTTGAEDGENITALLSIDGFPAQEISGIQETLTFAEQSLAEGEHRITMQAIDDCGNVGSVAGFVNNNGQEDWSQPLDYSVRVDLSSPDLVLEGIAQNQILTPLDDANQNSTDGFQLDVTVRATGFEVGQELLIFSGEQRLITQPAQILVSNSGIENIAVSITLPPGPHQLNVEGSDACDNPSQSDIVEIQVAIEGCSSHILNLVQNEILGPNDGAQVAGGLRVDIAGNVDLLDLNCSEAQVELWSVQNATQTLLASGDLDEFSGAVLFEQVTLPEGVLDLFIRTRLNNEVTDSLSRGVQVDITAPRIEVTQPALDAQGQGVILGDTDSNAPGQQFTLITQINEDPVVTTRTIEVIRNDQVIRNNIEVVDQSTQSEVRISDLNAAPGITSYQVCVRDLAGNEGCKSWSLDADPSAPSSIDANIIVLNNREVEVEARFTAPSDDDLGVSAVEAYEIRWSLNEITDELDWDLANVLAEQIALAVPNTEETLIIDQLPPNELLYVSIRARDDAERLGAVTSTLVDTRLLSHEIEFSNNNDQDPTWDVNSLALTNTNPLQAIGDINQDGFDDLLVVGAQSFANINKSGSMIVFGAASFDDTSTIKLNKPANFTEILFGSGGAALGDINGDGSPDFAVLGFLGDFSGAGLAIYFGCTDNATCDTQQLATPDVVINMPTALRNSVTGIGDVAQLQGSGFNDILIGGGVDVPNQPYVDPQAALIIEGRETWPASIDGSAPDQNQGVYFLDPQINNMGVYASALGDINQDGIDDLAMSGGGNLDQLFVVYGGSSFENHLSNGVWAYQAEDPDFIQLENPCPVGSSNFGTFIRGGYDLDGDDVNDFVVGNRANKSMIIIKNDLSLIECFSRSEDLFGIYFDVVGDIDQDGSQDLIATHDDPGNTLGFVFYNDGEGTFGRLDNSNARQASLVVREPIARKVAVSAAGDMNQDGKDDFAVMTYEASSQLFIVSVFY